MNQSDQLPHPREHLNVLFESVKHELRQGKGFVPLLGAGISAGSGVPLINELRAYLAQCILRVFGIYEETPVPVRRWDPKKDRWPPVQNLSQGYYNKALLDLDRLVTGWRLDSSTDQFKEQSIGLEALGALADWKTSLLFLSRVNLNHTNRCVDHLGSPDYDVVDKFFRTVTGGKRASLTHFMIAQLAKPMRCELLLTMNFDELVEEAFEQTLEPIDQVAIHLDTQLPAVAHLKEKRTLIKLHGGHYGLRADYSLDQEPTKEDVDTFASYFNVGSSRAMNHALVIGVSGYERRIVSLLRQSILKTKENTDRQDTQRENERMQIYWLCHSSNDVASVKGAFRNQINIDATDSDEAIEVRTCEELLQHPSSKTFDVLIIEHPFTGLLLLQLFQELTSNIPPRKSLFPSAAQLAVPPAYVAPSQYKDFSDKVQGDLNAAAKMAIDAAGERFTESTPEARMIRITEGMTELEETSDGKKAVPELGHGATSLAAFLFYRELALFSRPIWLSMENIGSADELFEQLTDAVARAVGIVDWMPIVLHEQHAKAVDEIRRLTEGRGKWIVFLDARDAAGNTRDSKTSAPEKPNGWLDEKPLTPEEQQSNTRLTKSETCPQTSNSRSFFDLISAITEGRECPNVNIVLLYHQYQLDGHFNETELHKQFKSRKLGKHIKVIKGTPFSEAYSDSNSVWIDKEITNADPFDHTKAASKGMEWRDIGDSAEKSALQASIRRMRAKSSKTTPQQVEDERTRRYYFLLGLVCSNRFRYPAMLHDNAFHPPTHLEINCNWEKGPIDSIQQRHELIFGDHSIFEAQNETHTDGWLSALAKPPHPVIRIAPGGFIWMHADTKQLLRGLIGLSVDLPSKSTGRNNDMTTSILFKGDVQENLKTHPVLRVPLRYACFRSQFGIAQWYDRLFMSSGDPLAGLESAAHFIEAASQGTAIIASESQARKHYDSWATKNEKADFAYDPWLQLTTSLSATLELMPQVRQSALATGYPKASCRMLVWLRAEKLLRLREAIARLRRIPKSLGTKRAYALDLLDRIILESIESTRTIAREVSEVGRAFHRNRQQFEFYMHRQLSANLEVPRDCNELLETMDTAKKQRLYLRRSEQSSFFAMHSLRRTDRNRSKPLEKILAFNSLNKASKSTKADYQKLYASENSVRKYLIEYGKHRRQSAEIALQSRSYGQSIVMMIDALRICFGSLEEDLSTGLEMIRADRDPLIEDLKKKTKDLKERQIIDAQFSCSAKQNSAATVFTSMSVGKVHSYRISEEDPLNSKLFIIHRSLLKSISSSLSGLIRGFKPESLRNANQEQMEEFRHNLLLIVRWCIVHIESLRYSINMKKTRKAPDGLQYIHEVAGVAESVYSTFCRASRGGPTQEQSALRNLELQRNMTAQMSTIYAQQGQWVRAATCLEAAAELHQPLHPDDGLLGLGVMELHKAQLSLLQIRDWPNKTSIDTGYETNPSAMRERLLMLLKASDTKRDSRQIGELLGIDDLLERWLTERIHRQQLQGSIDALDAPRGYLDDAEMALQAAEEVLVKKRKNVWWSTWLFQLQAKAIEYRLLLDLTERTLEIATLFSAEEEFSPKAIRHRRSTKDGASKLRGRKDDWLDSLVQKATFGSRAMPTFGQQDSPRNVPTALDIALENTMRMVRLDILRASRLVETYATCHWGLSVLLALDPDLERLPTRQKSMRDRLGRGIESLERCSRARQDFTPSLDLYVDAYAKNTLQFARDAWEKTTVS